MWITRRIEFSASHWCYNPSLSGAENLALYGADANRHGHGHNYALEVTLEGAPDAVTGMVVDLKEVKRILEEEVVEPMDHRHLNHEVPPFGELVPTTENLAVEIWRRLAPRFAGGPARLSRVRLFETGDLFVDYAGELT
ncbi:MAG: 6-carboxytetrahydropterin synthase [Candidatus Solibacter usitatus]|nr:6-carboxytetrahydropterin synthase [Candidatus Solibacter usitatus]